MKVLVTGAQGQVGRCLLASAPADFTVVGLTRAQLDVGDADAVQRAIATHAPAVIINAAAYTAVDRAETEVDAARRVNAAGPRHLAHAAATTGARLVHISTDFVFDGRAGVPYPPDAPTSPLGVYGLTKLEGEQAVLELLPKTSVVVRTAWVYAAHGANFLRTMLRVMGEKGLVRVVADQVGTPTAADSLAGVLWALAQRPDVGSAALHRCGGGELVRLRSGHRRGSRRAGTVVPGGAGPGHWHRRLSHPGAPTRLQRTRQACAAGHLGLEHQHWRVSLRQVLGALSAAPRA